MRCAWDSTWSGDPPEIAGTDDPSRLRGRSSPRDPPSHRRRFDPLKLPGRSARQCRTPGGREGRLRLGSRREEGGSRRHNASVYGRDARIFRSGAPEDSGDQGGDPGNLGEKIRVLTPAPQGRFPFHDSPAKPFFLLENGSGLHGVCVLFRSCRRRDFNPHGFPRQISNLQYTLHNEYTSGAGMPHPADSRPQEYPNISTRYAPIAHSSPVGDSGINLVAWRVCRESRGVP
jgi:hypothetical protein